MTIDKMKSAIDSFERALIHDAESSDGHVFTSGGSSDSKASRELLLLAFIKDRYPEYEKRIEKLVRFGLGEAGHDDVK